MNIAVIAADGRTGRAFVQTALAAGHVVRAGVHSATATLPSHPNLTTTHCDATNPDDVDRLITGQDAVASFIGHVPKSDATVQTDAITIVVASMKRLGLKRIVSLTGTGVRFEGDHIPLMDHIMTMGIRLIDPQRVADGISHVDVLKASGLDWTVVRVLKLEDVEPSAFSLKAHGPTKWYVGRKEVAQAVLQVINENSFIQQAPIIARADSRLGDKA